MRFITLLAGTALLIIACDTDPQQQAEVETTTTETQDVDPSQVQAEDPGQVPVLRPVEVDEEELADAAVLKNEIGPEGTTIDVLRTEADEDRMIVQMRVENIGETPASFQLDPMKILALTPDLSLMVPALGGAADSGTEMSSEAMTIELAPEESEIVSLQFHPPEREVQSINLHLPDTDPIEGLSISWAELPEDAEETAAAEDDEVETTG